LKGRGNLRPFLFGILPIINQVKQTILEITDMTRIDFQIRIVSRNFRTNHRYNSNWYYFPCPSAN